MAAPKKWGYTRDQAIGDEMLVSWTDGDLTEILVKEIEERLLAQGEERARVAAWARAAHATSTTSGKDWIAEPREALLGRCREVVSR